VVALSSDARATLTFTLHDGVNPDVVITGSGATPIIVNVTIGNFTVSGTVDGPPNPADTGPAFLSQTQNTVNVSSTGGGTLTLTLADTGLTLPGFTAGTLVSKISDSRFDNGGTPVPGANFTFQSWMNPANTTTPGGSTGGSQGPFTTAPIANEKDTAVLVPGAPFSLINMLTLTTPGAVTLADTTQLMATPEPGTIVMAAGGIPLAIAVGWLRRRRARA
jgi:hypothetical protein